MAALLQLQNAKTRATCAMLALWVAVLVAPGLARAAGVYVQNQASPSLCVGAGAGTETLPEVPCTAGAARYVFDSRSGLIRHAADGRCWAFGETDPRNVGASVLLSSDPTQCMGLIFQADGRIVSGPFRDGEVRCLSPVPRDTGVDLAVLPCSDRPDQRWLRVDYIVPADVDAMDGSGDTELHRLIRSGSGRTPVVAVLQAHANPDIRNYAGDAPIHVAVAKDHPSAVGWLLDASADIEARNGLGRTALTSAVLLGHRSDAVQLLVERGAQPSHEVLVHAVQQGDQRLIERLLGAGTPSDALLEVAVEIGETDIVEQMLAEGAVVSPDELVRAVERDDAATVDVLLSAGAEPGAAMMTAIQARNKPMVSRLYEWGASIEEREHVEYWIVRDDEDMTRFLLDLGARQDLALEVAIAHRRASIVEWVIQETDVLVDEDHLRVAVSGQDEGIVGMVLEVGPEPQAGMMAAIDADSAHMVVFLVERGADATPRELIVHAVVSDQEGAVWGLGSVGARVDWTLDDGTPLLHLPAQRCSQVASALLFYGADVNRATQDGTTPLHVVARQKKCRELLIAFLEHGALLNTRDGQGRTPLSVVQGCRKKRRLKKAGGVE